MVTLTLKNGSKKDINLLIDIAHKLGLELSVSATVKENLGEDEKNFLYTLSRSAREAKDIAEGKRKGKPLNELLDEL